MNGRIITSDLDCADCLCAVCARNQDTSMDNSGLKRYEKVCDPCNNCRLGQELIETEDDCSKFLSDNYDEISMRESIDFILYKSGDKKTIFKFYPNKSHVHGFRDYCPKTWEEVYKVYYSWEIINEYEKTYSDDIISLFKLHLDECSQLVNLSNALNYCITNGKNTKLWPTGQPSSFWEINFIKGYTYSEDSDEEFFDGIENKEKDILEISVWNNYTHQGYRFNLYRDEVSEFIKYLNEVNEYMLQHSEPI